MSQRSVFCIAASRDRADRMVQRLNQHTFPGAEISVVFLDRRATAPDASGSRAFAGIRPAQALRDVLRWLTGRGRLAIRSLGLSIDADPRAVVRPRTHFAGTGADDTLTMVEVTTTKLSLLNALATSHAIKTDSETAYAALKDGLAQSQQWISTSLAL